LKDLINKNDKELEDEKLNKISNKLQKISASYEEKNKRNRRKEKNGKRIKHQIKKE
jgi:hypothetical protein